MTLPGDPSVPFGRVLTAMVTPFANDGTLDLAAAQRLAAELVDLGNDGLVLNGTTGESPTTTDAEKADLVRAVVEAVGGRATIVAGVGTNDTAHTVRLAQQAQGAGADGLLVVTPYYSKPPQPALVAHFTRVADATDLPLMLYDIPGRAGVRLSADTLRALGEHPRIVANKDAAGDPYGASERIVDTGLAWYSGDDGLNLPLLAVGAVGFVSVTGHFVADRLAAMVQAFLAGQVGQAQQINTGLLPVIAGVMGHTQGAVATKAGLDLLGRPGGGPLRPPLLAATPGERELVAEGLRAGGVIG